MDFQKLVTVSDDRTIRVWNISTRFGKGGEVLSSIANVCAFYTDTRRASGMPDSWGTNGLRACRKMQPVVFGRW